MACHDVGQVPKGLRRVALGSDVDVDSAAPGGVALCSGLAEAAAQLLQGFNVLVAEDRGDQFALFAVRSLDADVSLEFPLAAGGIPSAPGIVSVAVGGVFPAACSEELGGQLRCSLAGDVVHFNLNADGLIFHLVDLVGGAFVHGLCLLESLDFSGFFPLVVYIYHSKREIYQDNSEA